MAIPVSEISPQFVSGSGSQTGTTDSTTEGYKDCVLAYKAVTSAGSSTLPATAKYSWDSTNNQLLINTATAGVITAYVQGYSAVAHCLLNPINVPISVTICGGERVRESNSTILKYKFEIESDTKTLTFT